MELKVSPSLSHTTEKVSITGNGFKPDSPITIQSTLICLEEGFDFQSYAHIYTNRDGCFDLKTNESVGGTYTGIEDMGLFWSMEKQGKAFPMSTFTNGLQNLRYCFSVFDGHVDKFEGHTGNAKVVITRYIARAVERILLRNHNFKGTLFVPERATKAPAIITLLGGNKKKNVKEHFASYLAHQGFVTLALAFFGVEGLPKMYDESPIRMEYFEEAIEFLRQHDSVDPEKIGVLGSSKGGDIAYAMMSHLPQIKAVCCMNGCIAPLGSDVLYKGYRTPKIPGDISKVRFITDNVVDTIRTVNDPYDHSECIHQIHQSKADLFIVVSLKDTIFPVSRHAQLAKQRMDEAGKINYQIIEYQNMGHLIELPNLPICLYDKHPLFEGLMLFFGGDDKKLISKDHVSVWTDVVKFFKSSFTVDTDNTKSCMIESKL
ncbi:acyl-coenzyme A thioesterase 2, mitochondrial-like [Clytia hemisphaerica]|uniref:acyl-coenzyme A thioesterase 2, mitochondrial-like n=1 Tax=Clytia hemisphaerica TaxID=252671 RepID=UPI0034D55E7C